MRAHVLLAVALVACGAPATPPPRVPEPVPEPVPDAGPPEPIAEPTPPPGACAIAPPTPESLSRLAMPGLLLVDATEPDALGACISRPLVLREGALACDPSGQRCRVGDHHVLLSHEQGDACVTAALVRYPDAPPEAEPEAVLDALSMRDEACALHDRVALSDPTLDADVTRARRIAPGRRGELAWECLTDDAARALAEDAHRRFAAAPLRCSGLRCESEHTSDDPAAAPAHSLLFAHRLAGPLRFDGVAWLTSAEDQPRALELLRRRCR